LQTKVIDLVFRVEDMGGKVQDLNVKETTTEVRIELAADVLFDFDKAEILPKAGQTLAQAAQVVREKAKGTVRIEGYTDAKGSDDYNQKLSDRRAAAVKAWFVRQQGKAWRHELRDSRVRRQEARCAQHQAGRL
jgi:outer membrane protein OmpA-like peptidoglycan-associated protein